MSLALLFHFLCAQNVSDINISIFRSLRLCCWITTSVVLFSVRCVLEIWCRLKQASACKTNTTQNQPHQISNTQRTENKTTDVVIQQNSRKLLKMDILMSETCWTHNKWNKIASDIKLVFHSSTRAIKSNSKEIDEIKEEYKNETDGAYIVVIIIILKNEIDKNQVTIPKKKQRDTFFFQIY